MVERVPMTQAAMRLMLASKKSRPMVDEMLIAQAKWLPQYQANGSIAAAKKRLAKCKRVKLLNWRGSARIKTKTVTELRQANESSVLAADKAAAQRAKDAAKAKR